jgi:hypothetical protein
MSAKRFIVGTLVGGVALYAVGYLIFVMTFGAFYAANAGSAAGVDRAEQLVWAVALGNLAYAALVVLVIANRESFSIAAGAQVGAVVGFLIWVTADFIVYGTTNIANLTRTVVDPLLEIVHGGIGGAVIAGVLKSMPAADRS